MFFPVFGLYIEQICLAALYFLKISEDRAASLAEGILMLILLAITISAQILIRRSFNRTSTRIIRPTVFG